MTGPILYLKKNEATARRFYFKFLQLTESEDNRDKSAPKTEGTDVGVTFMSE